MKKLNGWQRLWILVAILYFIVLTIYGLYSYVDDDSGIIWQYVIGLMLIWSIPSLTLYILGRAIGWVYKGFKNKQTSNIIDLFISPKPIIT